MAPGSCLMSRTPVGQPSGPADLDQGWPNSPWPWLRPRCMLAPTHGFMELEAGCGDEGPVIRLCRLTSQPRLPKLEAWLEREHNVRDERLP